MTLYTTCDDCNVLWKNSCPVCKQRTPKVRLKYKHTPLKGNKISKRVSYLIKQGHSKECVCCQSVYNLTFDHIIPLSKGGSDNNSNGQVLCEKCNSVKGNKIITIKQLQKLIYK